MAGNSWVQTQAPKPGSSQPSKNAKWKEGIIIIITNNYPFYKHTYTQTYTYPLVWINQGFGFVFLGAANAGGRGWHWRGGRSFLRGRHLSQALRVKGWKNQWMSNRNICWISFIILFNIHEDTPFMVTFFLVGVCIHKAWLHMTKRLTPNEFPMSWKRWQHYKNMPAPQWRTGANYHPGPPRYTFYHCYRPQCKK